MSYFIAVNPVSRRKLPIVFAFMFEFGIFLAKGKRSALILHLHLLRIIQNERAVTSIGHRTKYCGKNEIRRPRGKKV